MRNKLPPVFSIVLAAALQVMPLLRNFVSMETQGLAPSGYAFILKIGVGAVALLGFDAVSSASAISISPATATSGVRYSGTITYSGAYAARMTHMTLTNVCMDTPVEIIPGLFAQCNGNNTATVTGTPAGYGTYPFTIQVWTGSGCGLGVHDTRSTSLTINSVPPTWLTTPSNTVAQTGSSVVLNEATSGSLPLGYTWLLGTNPVPVSTQASLTNNNVQLTDAGLYTVAVSNASGSISTNFNLSVVTVPPNSWLDGSTPLTVTNYQVVGSTLNLSAFITNVPAAQNQYKWEFKYVPVATTPSLVVVNVQTNKSGLFTIILTSTLTFTNGASITTNLLANVEYDSNWQFGHAPAIQTQPTNQTVSYGGSALFTVAASGDSLMGTNYQWYFNSSPLAGQTNASLAVTVVNAGNVGNYFVTVTNVYGAQTSSIVSLSGPSFPPVVTAPPTNQTVACGGTATFSVGAVGSSPLSYQWYLNGQPVIGETNASYTTNGVIGPVNAFAIASVVTNPYGSVTNTATLAVELPTLPAIPNSTVECGGNATFSVGAAVLGLSYQWYLNGSPVIGATNTTYLTNGVFGAGHGYLVMVMATSRCGSTSNSATLTVVDTTPPAITLLGNNLTNILINETYVDAGATATDSCAGTVAVRVNNPVNTSGPGTFVVTYTADDGNGNTNVATRTVVVSGCADAPVGLVDLWEAEGNALDSAGTNNGILGSGVSYTNGEVSQAFNFDGTVNCSATFGKTAGNFGTNDFTIEFWLRTTATGAYDYNVMEKRVGCYSGSFLVINLGDIPGGMIGNVRVGLEDASGNYNVFHTTNSINDGLYHHVAVVRQGVNASIYVDGAFNVSAASALVLSITNNANFVMGTSVCEGLDGTEPFLGDVDEVSIYNRALAASEIQSIYAAGSDGKCRGSSSTAPVITLQPTNQTAECGGNATFNASATGTAPLSYQWYLNSSPFTGATNTSYTVSGATLAESGYPVSVRVANAYSAVSVGATLTVIDTTPPVITILGNNPINIQSNVTYVDAGATANDSCAGVVPVRVVNPVNTGVPGTYLITYTTDDGNGNTNLINRTVVVGSVSAVPSARLLQEGQDYPVSYTTPATGRGPWSLAGGSGVTSFITIQPGDLSGATVPDILPLPNTVNSAAKLQVAKAGTTLRWYYRSLSNNVTAGSVYFSFLLNVTVNPTMSDEFMGSLLAGGATNQPAATDPLTFHARTGADATHFDLGIQRLNGTVAWSGDLADNTTYLVVLKYTFGGVNSLYVDPTPGGDEPMPTASANSDGVTDEPASIGTVLFYESSLAGGTSGTYQYDVMRADINWTNVTPAVGSASAPTVNLQTSIQTGILQLTWPISTTSFHVQTANSPLGPWTNATIPISTNGANASVQIMMTNQQQYYRLLGN